MIHNYTHKAALLIGILTLILGISPSVTAQKRQVKLGILVGCPSNTSDILINQVKKEAQKLFQSDVELIVSDELSVAGSCEAEDVKRKLDDLVRNPAVDIIFVADPLASHIAAKNAPFAKPVIAGAILNTQIQKIPLQADGSSGVQNFTYLQLPYSPIRDLEVFERMIGFEKLAILEDKKVFDGIPEMRDFIQKRLNELEIDYEFVGTETTASATLAKIDDSFDAVYLFPSVVLSPTEYQNLLNGLKTQQLKSFSLLGKPYVELGALAGVAPESNLGLIARRIVLDIQRITGGEKASQINTKLLKKEELVVNMETARQIGYSPSWEVIAEAVLLNEERTDISRNVSLYDVIEEGLAENLDIKIVGKDLEVSQQNVRIANANLLPSLTANVNQTVVDQTSAEQANGQNPQFRGQGNLQASQLIFSESAWANKRIQELLVQASEQSLGVQSLNTVLNVSVTYLNLMQAKTGERIQKQNLEVTRKNLEIARVSSSLGQTGPSDLYRWQGEIANAKAALLNATAQRRQAELALNQILNRPVGEEFQTIEIDIEDTRLVVNNDVIGEYVTNPASFARMTDFMVERAKIQTPDLKQIDFSVRAQERSLLLANRNRYLPTIALGGNLNYEFYRAGSGSDAPAPFEIPGMDPVSILQQPEELNWNAQLSVSLPIFQGGNRLAQIQRNRVQVDQLNVQRLNVQRQIEQQIRGNMENLRASYRNVELTQDAAEAVTQNFELVQDAYAKGLVTITQLVDAQNASISTQLNAANAQYIFLIDLLSLERAMGSFYMLLTEEERASYADDIKNYLNP